MNSLLILAVTISWSVFHPVWPDVDYFKRVVAKADAYGGVDSFEACGRCADPRGGLNGFLLYEPYPSAARDVDRAWVAKNVETMNEIVAASHESGRQFYYWHREIFMPKGILKDVPELKDADGEFDLLGKAYENYLRWKIDAAFKAVPGLDGIVLTLTEADFSVIHNSNKRRYPPVKVVEHLVRIFAEAHERLGKKLIVRSFGSVSEDYEDILAGCKAAAVDHRFEVETKVTPYDFDPFLPNNPFLRKLPGATLGAECDSLGEYFGAGYFPAAQVPVIRRYVGDGQAKGVDRFTIRIDRVGNSIFDSAHEVNLYAYMRFIRDPKATPEDVMDEWAARRWKGCEEPMKRLAALGFEAVRHTQFADDSVAFHQNPPSPNFKYVKACGIFSIFRDGFDLHQTEKFWGMLSDRKTPGRKAILAEKDRAVAEAEEGFALIRTLKGRLPDDEYARHLRAWRNIATVAKATREYFRCACAYFDDMDANAPNAPKLTAAIAAAERTISALMKDPGRTVGAYSDHCSAMGEDMDVAYLYPLRWFCREFLREYRAEFAARQKFLGRQDVIDFVIPGGMYDDVRCWRTAMHASYQDVEAGVPVRYAGNGIFPNGTVRVEFKDDGTSKLEVELDLARGAKECMISDVTTNGIRTVAISKKGTDYPAIRSIALMRAGGMSAGTAAEKVRSGYTGWFFEQKTDHIERMIDRLSESGMNAIDVKIQTFSKKGYELAPHKDVVKALVARAHAKGLKFNVYLYPYPGTPSREMVVPCDDADVWKRLFAHAFQWAKLRDEIGFDSLRFDIETIHCYEELNAAKQEGVRAAVAGFARALRELAPGLPLGYMPAEHHPYSWAFDRALAANEVRLEIGNGWYNPLPWKMWGGLNLREYLAVGTPCVSGTLRLVHQDGRAEELETDGNWQAADGTMVFNSIYRGETRDFTRNVGEWTPVRVVEGPQGKVVPRGDFPTVVVRERVKAQKVVRQGDKWLVDFGVNLAGTIRLRLHGTRAGARLVCRYGESLWSDGTLNPMSAVCGNIRNPSLKPHGVAEQRDECVCRAAEELVFEPRFTFHAFRYLEISGFAGKLTADDVEALAWSADVKTRGFFRCSNERLNQLHEVCLRTFRNNLQSVQSDCPGREKFGYGGDIAATAESFSLNYDMAAFYRKTVRDFLDAAEPDGWFTETAPFNGIHGGAPKGASVRAGPIGWAVAVPIMLDAIVRYDGDLGIVREAYPALKRYLANLEGVWPEGLADGCLGDWLAIVPPQKPTSGTAHYYQFAALTAKLARLIGVTREAEACDRLAAKIAASFRTKHVRTDGVYWPGCPSAQAFGLYHADLLTADQRAAAYRTMKEELYANGCFNTAGLFGTQYLLEVLSAGGDMELAGKIVLNDNAPGWMRMLDLGATTLCENWYGTSGWASLDHPMFGSVEQWFYRHLLGIDVPADAIGCDRIRVDPKPIAGVDWAEGWLDTPKGRISVSWRKMGVRIEKIIRVPEEIKVL